MFFPVTLPNFFPPKAVSWKETDGLLFLSKLELASFNISPETITLLFIIYKRFGSLSSSKILKPGGATPPFLISSELIVG